MKREIEIKIREAYQTLFEAWEALRKHQNDEAIRKAIKCIKASMETVRKTSKYLFNNEDIIKTSDKIIEKMNGIIRLERRRIARALLIERIWLNPYLIRLVEKGTLDLKPKSILKEEEARIAVDHASEVYYWADSVVFKLIKSNKIQLNNKS